MRPKWQGGVWWYLFSSLDFYCSDFAQNTDSCVCYPSAFALPRHFLCSAAMEIRRRLRVCVQPVGLSSGESRHVQPPLLDRQVCTIKTVSFHASRSMCLFGRMTTRSCALSEWRRLHFKIVLCWGSDKAAWMHSSAGMSTQIPSLSLSFWQICNMMLMGLHACCAIIIFSVINILFEEIYS